MKKEEELNLEDLQEIQKNNAKNWKADYPYEKSAVCKYWKKKIKEINLQNK